MTGPDDGAPGGDTPDDPEDLPPPIPGTQVPGPAGWQPGRPQQQPPGWQTAGQQPAPPGWPPVQPPRVPGPEQQSPQPWGEYAPPPGWAPATPQRMRKGEIFLGVVAWFVVNGLLALVLTSLGDSFGGTGGLSLLFPAVNLGMIVVPAIKGHKGFAVGFALGFVVAFVLALGACFLILASL